MARESGARDGVTLAVRAFFLRHRVVLLSIVLSGLGFVTGPAAMTAYLQGFSPLETSLLFAGAALACVVGLLQTRHLALAILMAIAPLPGLAWAAPLAGDATFGAVPLLAYGFGFAVAAFAADDVVWRVLQDAPPRLPLRQVAAALGLMVTLAATWFWRSRLTVIPIQTVADTVLATLSVLIVVPLGAFFLPFDESFIARANRAREWRERTLEALGAVATPRWGLSFGGIALIVLALAWFGAEPSFSFPHLHEVPLMTVMAGAMTLLVALASGASWRDSLAAGVVCVLVGLVALWGFAILKGITAWELAAVSQAVALAALLVFCGAARTADYRKRNEDAVRAMEETGAPQFFAMLGAAAALAPSVIYHRSYAVYAIALLFAGVGALLFAPALAAAIAALLPRRRSVEELYGRG
jgi:hypothetical protein